jgi:hypothetical protein
VSDDRTATWNEMHPRTRDAIQRPWPDAG